jgi:BRCT domain type II-containing protein
LELLYYHSDFKTPDGAVTDGELTPVVLLGGKVIGSISSKTSYIVAGENMGPSKLAKAEKLGTHIISEDEFLAMVE